jgi:anti-sigma B factor antagonist
MPRMTPQPASGGHVPPAGIVAGIERHGDALVLVVVGEVDALTAPQLVDAVDAALAQHPVTLVADLTKVDFFASAGLAALIDAHRKAGEKVRFRVVAAGAATLRPLQLTGLTEELAVFASREDALMG